MRQEFARNSAGSVSPSIGSRSAGRHCSAKSIASFACSTTLSTSTTPAMSRKERRFRADAIRRNVRAAAIQPQGIAHLSELPHRHFSTSDAGSTI